MASGNPKPAFYLAVLAVVLGLVGLALWRLGALPGVKSPTKITKDQMTTETEAPDTSGITTAKEYKYVPAAKLPPVQGISSYKPLADRTVRFAINVWAGWAPIILANNGFKAGKIWKTPGGKDFKVELILIDDPVAMRDAYAAGNVHVGWGTLDMVPLFMEALHKDSRVMPRIYQQVDWSNGGDGIVVRDSVKSIADLRGKTVVLAQNSPSHFFVLNALINGGVQPGEVNFKFTQDAFQAAAAFNADKKIAGAVSWSPDIYNLAKVKGNRMLVTTTTANKLIADIWFARADFAKDNPDIIEGLVRGIFDGMESLKDQNSKAAAAKLMAAGYSIPEADALSMQGDAHSTNWAENQEFFLNQNNPTNFERTWNTAYYLYKRIGAVSDKTEFDQVMDFSVLQKLGKEPKYANQKNEYDVQFAPATAAAIQGESDEILTKTVVIHFFPNSWDLGKKITDTVDGKSTEKLYDPNATFVVEEIGKMAGQFGAARIVIEGHSDSSMKDRVPESAVQELSANRANAVKESILKKFPTLQPNQFSVAGMGWARPADPNDPLNQAKNRRVEVKVYPLEATK
ncbi:MAG TPA: phosphate ABC transporter substrate-binding/OmpA family protein [Bryobacteraceae bacterium]|jgi:NitT/TauT family transport system substrate-binding protein|nr:phosphate ABC transporter substrate-binding/OmpA family protein [Bryobacteraceae bacterium]